MKIKLQRRNLAILLALLAGSSAFLAAIVVIESSSKDSIILSTTTSTENSGLLSVLTSEFEARFGIEVLVSAKGTGAALQDARHGNADLVLVHARDLELEFVNQGFGYRRACFMHNDFVLLGPRNDPLNISVEAPSNITAAFEMIAAGTTSEHPFVSRGDNSGTHVKELQIWNQTSLLGPPMNSSIYQEVGAGMGTALVFANEVGGYILSDRGTWYAMEQALPGLEILVENDPGGVLLNPYSFILVNKTRFPNVRQDLAEKFVAFCLSGRGLELIDTFRVNGKRLFIPHWGTNTTLDILASDPDDVAFWEEKISEIQPFIQESINNSYHILAVETKFPCRAVPGMETVAATGQLPKALSSMQRQLSCRHG